MELEIIFNLFDLAATKKVSSEQGRLVEVERKETGSVALSVYVRFLRSCTAPLCLATVLLYVVNQSLLVASNFALSIWSSESSAFERNTTGDRWNSSSQVRQGETAPHR